MTRKSAFTLIEMMVVVGIIVILASLAVPNFSMAVKKGRDAVRKSDVAAIQQALVSYRADEGSYPSGDIRAVRGALVSTYISALPIDPSSKSDYIYSGGGNSFTICSGQLETIVGGKYQGNSSSTSYTACDPNTSSYCKYYCLKNP